MATITEDYVSFETAKLLKEKGFNEKLLTFYITDEAEKESDFQTMYFTDDKIDNNQSPHCYLAPTLQMAIKWLREVHDIDVSVVPLRSHKEYLPRVEGDITSHDDIPCRKYEEACEVAIKYCLENLIQNNYGED
jgi:hypothetical protein